MQSGIECLNFKCLILDDNEKEKKLNTKLYMSTLRFIIVIK